jgi:hypothetical protein
MSYIPPPAQPTESTVNSSVATLASGATFTGAWESCVGYEDISIAVNTDFDGTYTIQFSHDGTSLDTTLTRHYRTAQIEAPHVFEVTRKFYRITFTNIGVGTQTYFRLQTILGKRGNLNIPIDATMSQDYDSTSVRPSDFRYEVALGRRQGSTTWNKFGYNSDVDTAATEVVAAFGGAFAPLTTASTLTISSSSANDTVSAGTGARSITVVGVNANYEYQTETIGLNGTTPVISVNSWLGVNRVSVNLAGSTQNNVGLITITATTGGATQATIPVGEGSTQQAIYFVEKSHKFLADFFQFNIEKLAGGTTPKVRIKGWIFNVNANCKYLIYNELFDTTIHSDTIILPSQPFVIDEKTCLWFEATTDQNDTFVSCRFSGVLFRNVNA